MHLKGGEGHALSLVCLSSQRLGAGCFFWGGDSCAFAGGRKLSALVVCA
jgi:hypothetical protein